MWPSGSERCFYDGHDRKVDGSTPTLASLLRPRIRYFTTFIFAWWNLTSSKLKKSKARFKRKTRKQDQLLSESTFVLCIWCLRPLLVTIEKNEKINQSKILRTRAGFTYRLSWLKPRASEKMKGLGTNERSHHEERTLLLLLFFFFSSPIFSVKTEYLRI